MKRILESYRKYLEDNNSNNTVSSYIGDVTRFLSELNIKNSRELSKIKNHDINEYISLLKSRGMAYSSISRTIASLKKFFKYCSDENVTTSHIVLQVEMPKIQRKLPNTMSSEDVVKLLEAPDTSTTKGLRDKAMLEFMYATGARVSEIISLKTGDVSLKNEMVVLTTGKKHRYVPLGKVAIDAMYVYIKDCRPSIVNAQSGDMFFLNLYGQPLTRQGFWKIVKKYIEDSGIEINTTAQTLRHSFALHLLTNGADVNSVAEMLGYSDVSSTKVYFDVMNNKIKEVYKKAHPRA